MAQCRTGRVEDTFSGWQAIGGLSWRASLFQADYRSAASILAVMCAHRSEGTNHHRGAQKCSARPVARPLVDACTATRYLVHTAALLDSIGECTNKHDIMAQLHGANFEPNVNSIN